LIRQRNGLDRVFAQQVLCSRNRKHVEESQSIGICHRSRYFVEIFVERGNCRFRQRFSIGQARGTDNGPGFCHFASQSNLSKIDHRTVADDSALRIPPRDFE
jgi:hypothetical protein